MTEKNDVPNEGTKSDEIGKEVQETNEVQSYEATEEFDETQEEQGLNSEIEREIANASPTALAISPTLPNDKDSFGLITETAKHLGNMGAIAETLIKSGLCPLKKKEDVILAIITGNQYNLPFMTSVNNIFPINGKPTLSIHLHRAMLLQHKIMFKKELDFEPMYEYAVKKGDKFQVIGVGTKYDKDDFPDAVKGFKEVDRITRYRFKRKVKQIDGTYETLEVVSEFRISEAVRAGLATKAVWENYPARMCDARAFGIGSKEIASDILFGIYSISELADVHNIPYNVSANLEETIIQDRG